jgi:hypothetical protein
VNDRELLELSAKGAGHQTKSDRLNVWLVEDDGSPIERWDPLTDDAQALRLAVKLGIDIESYSDTVSADGIHEARGIDDCEATRRAIVRAAAEIGSTRSD